MTSPAQKTGGIAKPGGHPPDDGHACASADETPYQEEEREEGCDPPCPLPKKSSAASDMVFVLVIMALFAAMMRTPGCVWAVRHWKDSTVPVAQGTVQRILYVGNLGIDTQIDTEQRSFIVQGITQLRVGARVETRKGTWAYALCDQDSGLCEDFVHGE